MTTNTTFTTDVALMILSIIASITPLILITTVGIPAVLISLTFGMLAGFAFLHKHSNTTGVSAAQHGVE